MIYRENMKTACFAIYDERDLTCLYIYLMINPKQEDENFLQIRVVYRTKYRTKKEKQKCFMSSPLLSFLHSLTLLRTKLKSLLPEDAISSQQDYLNGCCPVPHELYKTWSMMKMQDHLIMIIRLC